MWKKQAGYGYMMACFDGRIGKRNVLWKSLDICVHLFALKTSMSHDVAECWNISNRLYWYDLLLYDGLRDNATTFYDNLCFKQSFTPLSLLAGCRLALQRDPATGLGKVGCPRENSPMFSRWVWKWKVEPYCLAAWVSNLLGQHGQAGLGESTSQGPRKKCATGELIGLFSIYFVPTLIVLDSTYSYISNTLNNTESRI